MQQSDRELKKGSAELLILSLVDRRARHGYEIAKQIETRSGGALKFKVASLYPLLYRLEARGWIAGTWVEREWIETVRRMRRARPPTAALGASFGAPSRKGGLMAGWLHDVKIAWRSMRTRPGFSLMVIGMLALGVAGNAAIFSLFNGLFLKP